MTEKILPICVWQYLCKYLTFPEQQHLRATCTTLRKLQVRHIPTYLHRLYTTVKLHCFSHIRRLDNIANIANLSSLVHLRELKIVAEPTSYPPHVTKLIALKNLNTDYITHLPLTTLKVHGHLWGNSPLTTTIRSLELHTADYNISNLTNLTSLKATLTCKINQFPTSLTKLDIAGRIDLQTLPPLPLVKLNASYGCGVTTFPTTLTSLNLNNRQDIQTLPPLPHLKTLHVSQGCRVTNFPTTLKTLDITNRRDLDISHLRIRRLYASGTNVRIPPSVEILDMEYTSLGIGHLTLKRLRVHDSFCMHTKIPSSVTDLYTPGHNKYVDTLRSPQWSPCRRFICTAVVPLRVPIHVDVKTRFYPARVEYFDKRELSIDIL